MSNEKEFKVEIYHNSFDNNIRTVRVKHKDTMLDRNFSINLFIHWRIKRWVRKAKDTLREIMS